MTTATSRSIQIEATPCDERDPERSTAGTTSRRRVRSWRRLVSATSVVLLALSFPHGASPVQAADPSLDYPKQLRYDCSSDSKCVYTGKDTSKYSDAVECMTQCGATAAPPGDGNTDDDSNGDASSSPLLSDSPQMTLSSSPNGTCLNCTMMVETSFNFPKLFAAYSLSRDQFSADSCDWKAQLEVPLPVMWTFDGNASSCFVGDTLVGCARGDNETIVSLDDKAINTLLSPPDSSSGGKYTVAIGQISTRLGPGNYSEKTMLKFKFTSSGCTTSTDNAKEAQALSVELTSTGYDLTGKFSDMNVTANDPRIMSATTVLMGFRNGAILRAGSFFLLRVAVGLEPFFGGLIQNVSNARMLLDIPDDDNDQVVPLDISIGAANLSFAIPASFNGTVNNGDVVKLMFDNFQNPRNNSLTIEKVYLSAYQPASLRTILAVDNSVVLFYKVKDAQRTLTAATLDIASVVVFGLCFLFSLVIIRWHGLPLTMSTLWTDLVAISALFSFATGSGGYLVWALQPSKAYVYWYSAQYYFNAVMVLSLCFHWAAVLSFKAFKKLTWKSPVVITYFFMVASVLVFIVICCVRADHKLKCVFDDKAMSCSSEEECSTPLAAVGRQVRDAVRQCKMQNFYLAFGTGFIIYTLMLMVLGCMVMRRGRSLMLNEDPSESRIRKSLTIFYIIISTTIVLYISAQVIYIAQYISSGSDKSELSDIVWYIFIIWLPQGLPPLLLLFLQWNPSTETKIHHNEDENMVGESIDESSKDDVFNMTPRSSGSSPNLHYSKLFRTSMADSMLNNDDLANKLRLVVRLKLPASFSRACFVSLDFCSTKESIANDMPLRQICHSAHWKCVGTTEPVEIKGADEDGATAPTSSPANAIFQFVAVLEVPVVGPASNTLLRFLVHANTIGTHSNSGLYDSHGSSSIASDLESGGNGHAPTQLSYHMTMFQPMLEFVTTSQAVLDAAASGLFLNVYPTDEQTHTVLHDIPALQAEVDKLLMGNSRNAELSVGTVMMPGEDPTKENLSHKNIGNIIRFFQYDSEDGGGGLVVEDLQEGVYSNLIPRQLIELIAVERQDQVEKAREDLNAFLNQKKDKQNRGFYGTLIGQIQDEGDAALAKEWLEARLKKRKEYVATIRKNIQYLVNRDKHKLYFKASVEKKSEDLRFVPINLHIQDLLIGPTTAFINEERRRASKEVSIYDFATVGAPAAHCYKFNKGGILSFQAKLKKMQAKIAESDLDLAKWPEEIRDYDDVQWDLQLRMDSCLAQAMAALTCSFVRKVEIAIQNADVAKGEDMLRQLSTLGFLFHVESLLSTHGKEIGMLEDMAGSIAQLSCVAFVIQDIRDKPSNRFSFRMSRKKDVVEEAAVVKVSVSPKTRHPTIKYIITVQVATTDVELPDRLAAGGEISVTPLLFTHGINEMQTIANNTERAKTELQDMININNLRPLKQFCEKYCRLAVALPGISSSSHYQGTGNTYRSGAQIQRGYKTMNQAPMRLTEEQVTQAFRALETSILDAAQSLVKTKRPEILQRSADLCRELGGGRVTVCKSAKDRTAMSVTLEQVRILHRHHDLPQHRIPATVSVMRSHGVRIENALKNTGKRMFAFNKLQRSLLPEEYRCPDQVGGTGNVS